MEAHPEARHASPSSAAEEAGSSTIARIVELTPVSYAGEQDTITIVRKPISKFMLDKPA